MFLGAPQMPHYKKKGSVSGLHFTNQDCVIRDNNGKCYLKFPYFHGDYLPIGYVSGSLKEVRVRPYYSDFLVICVYETESTEPLPENGNACGIDFGISNIVALVSNTQKCMCYKGGALKAQNQWYNKQRSYYQSIAMQGHEAKEAKQPGVLNTRHMEQLNRKRNQFFHDALHKIASDVVKFCFENDIRAIVLGKNKNWKPEENGLFVMEQEESYTPKASLVDGDKIPVVGDQEKPSFSGKRVSGRLYCTKEQMLINADLNGAGNILRKAYPTAFEGITDYHFLNKMIVKKYNTMYSSNG